MKAAAERGLTLALGAALGALATGLLLQALERPATVVDASEARPRAPAAPVASSASTTLPLPRERSAPSASAPDANESSEVSSTRIRAAQPSAEIDATSSELLAALEAAYARGDVGQEELVQLLFGVLLSHGNPQAALDLVDRFRPQDAGALVQIAVAFAQQGKQALAQEVLARALALDPQNEWVLNQYAGVDPAGALPHFLARLGRQEPPGDPGLRLEIAQLYESAGRGAEARAQVDAILREDPRNVDALRFLASVDPESAERLVHELIAGGDGAGEWQGFLLELMINQGHPESALAMLERNRDLGLVPEAGAYGAIAQKYLELQQPEAAIAMWTRAFDAEQGDPDSWTTALQEHAPEKLLAMLEARTARGANDEFWGALGDARWRAGRRSEAVDAWREAARQDPEDDEWSSKLAAVTSGLEPL